MPTPRVVTSASELDEIVVELAEQPRYAIDTEFHRERTYYPKVALIQVAWAGRLALVDPLAVSLEPLAKVLTGDGVAVLHAATQDLEVLELVCGATPARLFDTQVAAGFVGMATPSLTALAERLLQVRLPKSDRLTDWLQRPLLPEQLAYAASDVAHLLELHHRLSRELDRRGRLGWAHAEFEELRLKVRPTRDPREAWRRIKELRHLRGRSLEIGRALAEWREERAAELDVPVRYVLADLAIVAIAQRAPRSRAELRALRGVDGRNIGGEVADQILSVVATAPGRFGTEPPRRSGTELGRDLKPVVGLITAWVAQLAHEMDLDASLVATRADIEALLRGDDGGRLSGGWRADLVGEPIRRLVEGEVAAAFSPGRGIELVERGARIDRS